MFDDLEGRLYHEVLLDHQSEQVVGYEIHCICGWKPYVKGVFTHRMHLATVIGKWLEANFVLIDKR